MKTLMLLCTLFFSIHHVSCQSENEITWDDFDWIVGDWIGDGFGGTSYESWSEPIAETMLGTYRHVGDGKNTFFELFTISKQEDNTFVMKLRHFNPDMSAWEDKSGQLVWEYKGATKDTFTFGPCTYKRIDNQKMEISLVMNNDGNIETEVFHFKRQ